MDKFELHRKAQDLIAQSYLTNSKRPESHVMGVYPTHIKESRGCYLKDHNGKSYMDFICGLGTNLLGYGHTKIATKIAHYLDQGFSPSFATHHELDAAERIKQLFPFIDAVKWLKTGTEACMAAIKIARAATGRKLVYSEGYHGWSDAFVSLTPPGNGVCKTQEMRPLVNKFPSEVPSEIAAIILEPVITDWSHARRQYLNELRDYCTRHGILLIFDEVITGFRFPRYSVSRFFGLEPDLIVLGKAIANGMPLACVGGNYRIMNCKDEYFVSSTYAGEILSLVAANETMRILQADVNLDELWNDGAEFMGFFNAIWPEGIRIEGYPTRGVFKGRDDLTKALFFQETCKAGIIFGPSYFFNFPLAKEVENIKGTLIEIINRLKRGEFKLEGLLPKSPFAQRIRENAEIRNS